MDQPPRYVIAVMWAILGEVKCLEIWTEMGVNSNNN